MIELVRLLQIRYTAQVGWYCSDALDEYNKLSLKHIEDWGERDRKGHQPPAKQV